MGLVISGLHYDTFEVFADKDRPFFTHIDSSASKLLPRVGMVYKLTPCLSLYVRYTESFKPNASIATQGGTTERHYWHPGAVDIGYP